MNGGQNEKIDSDFYYTTHYCSIYCESGKMRNLILVAVLFLGGCSFVGTKLPDSLAGCSKKQESCSISDKNVSGSYRITRKASASLEYSVEGSAYLNKSLGEEYRRANFTLLLLKDRVVVAEIGMVSGDGDASKGMDFHGTFSNDFDESIMDYSFMFR